jgi:hypothetical protein
MGAARLDARDRRYERRGGAGQDECHLTLASGCIDPRRGSAKAPAPLPTGSAQACFSCQPTYAQTMEPLSEPVWCRCSRPPQGTSSMKGGAGGRSIRTSLTHGTPSASTRIARFTSSERQYPLRAARRCGSMRYPGWSVAARW